jgi:hypothetical protein
VVINEAIELAKSYGGTDGHRFVNGVLDKLAPTLRRPKSNPRAAAPPPPDVAHELRRARVGAGVWAVVGLRWGQLAAAVLAIFATCAEGAVSVYCTHDPDACELAAQTFTRDTGINIAMVRKPTGEVFAQLRAERDNPKADVWYGGTFDSFVQGAAEGLFAPYRSPNLKELHPWAQRQASAMSDRAVAIYRIVIGFGTNSALLGKKASRLRAAGPTS